jgi:hypothetical protein
MTGKGNWSALRLATAGLSIFMQTFFPRKFGASITCGV